MKHWRWPLGVAGRLNGWTMWPCGFNSGIPKSQKWPTLVNFRERNRHDLREIRLCFCRARIWEAAPIMHLANKESCFEFSKGLSECCPHYVGEMQSGKNNIKFGKHCITSWPWLTGGMEDHLEVIFCWLNHNWRSRWSRPPHSPQISQRISEAP